MNSTNQKHGVGLGHIMRQIIHSVLFANVKITCSYHSLDVLDHIIELKDGGAPFDEDNVQSLCHRHHNKKTAQVKSIRKLSVNHQLSMAGNRVR